jgi:hypothetical protein
MLYSSFVCYICGKDAMFNLVMQKDGVYEVDYLKTNKSDFYVCKDHEYIYERMKKPVGLLDYFKETLKENK